MTRRNLFVGKAHEMRRELKGAWVPPGGSMELKIYCELCPTKIVLRFGDGPVSPEALNTLHNAARAAGWTLECDGHDRDACSAHRPIERSDADLKEKEPVPA